MLIEGKDTTSILRVVTSQSSPVTEATALPRIQQYLGNQRAAEAVEREFKQLKAKAKITYQGEFASAESGAATPANEPAKAVAIDAAPAEKSPASTSIEKGVAGLMK
jgi:hypothetical protein